MADTFTKEERSELMSKIGSKGTKPEMKIRKGLHALGFRYSLHDKKLPGKPDLKMPKHNAVIEVNGCFWHGHDCDGSGFRLPKSRIDYWKNKIEGNRIRDKKNIKKLREKGWRVLIIWECSMRGKRSYEITKILEKTKQWLLSDDFFSEIQNKLKEKN